MHATVRQGLTDQHIDHYCPIERFSRRNHRRGWTDHVRPLLPGYIFAQTTRLDLVRATDGVVRLVGFPDPLPMSQAAVERLYAIREAEAAGMFDRRRTQASFKAGQSVRIVSGPFEGYIATILSQRGRRRLAIAMEAMGLWRGGSTEIDAANVRAA